MTPRRRGSRASLPLACTLLAFSVASGAAACGSRTGLLVPEDHESGVAKGDSGMDANEEPDVVEEPDVLVEADALEEPEVFVPPDAPDICPDAGSTFIYVITLQGQLLSFYPPTAQFTTVGAILCPDMGTPFSMAVDRQGSAYVEYTPSGNLYRVSTKTAFCESTPFQAGNGGFPTNFGMGFSADVGDAGVGSDAGETLYVAGDLGGLGMGPSQLGWIDLSTFQTHPVGSITPTIEGVELTGTGAGQLFGFYYANGTPGEGAIGQLDKTSANLVSNTTLPAVNIMNGWAFAFWGGDFYTFTAPDGTNTVVQRYRPSDGSVVQVTQLNELEVVGAGVSTCAPQM
jgi:hypothetical protein